MPKLKVNPRGPIRDWKDKLKRIDKLRKKVSLEVACVEEGIAYSTYHEWRKRARAEAPAK